jgi:hypothetical protein
MGGGGGPLGMGAPYNDIRPRGDENDGSTHNAGDSLRGDEKVLTADTAAAVGVDIEPRDTVLLHADLHKLRQLNDIVFLRRARCYDTNVVRKERERYTVATATEQQTSIGVRCSTIGTRRGIANDHDGGQFGQCANRKSCPKTLCVCVV